MSHWCTQHPKYEAKRQPNSLCGRCWQLYFFSHPEEKPPTPTIENQGKEWTHAQTKEG